MFTCVCENKCSDATIYVVKNVITLTAHVVLALCFHDAES